MYFRVSSLERGEDNNLPENVGRCIEMLWSEVTKGLNFILDAGTSEIGTNSISFKCFFVTLPNRFYSYDMPSDAKQMLVFFLFGGTNKHI